MYQTLFRIPITGLQIAALVASAICGILFVTGRWADRKSSATFGGVFLVLIGVLQFVRTNLQAQKADEVIPIFGFGSMLFLAFVASAGLTYWRCRREGLDGERVVDMGLWIFLGGMVGARLLFIIRNPDQFNGFFDFFKTWNGGMVFYGGVVTGTIVFIYYTRRYKLPVWRVVDVLAPSIALAIGIGRFGCLLNGCCWGTISDLSWAVRFPAGSAPWDQHLREHLIDQTAAASLPVHPTQIYLALAGLLLWAITTAYFPYRRRHGEVLAVLMIGYAVTRFVIEYFRADEPQWADGLTISQNISIVIFVGGVLLWWWLRRYPPVQTARTANAQAPKETTESGKRTLESETVLTNMSSPQPRPLPPRRGGRGVQG